MATCLGEINLLIETGWFPMMRSGRTDFFPRKLAAIEYLSFRFVSGLGEPSRLANYQNKNWGKVNIYTNLPQQWLYKTVTKSLP